MQTFRNWKFVMWLTLIAIFLFWFPLSRSAILWILPLGSGVDDLIFLVLLFIAFVLLLIRVMPVKNKIKKLAEWLMK